MTRFARLWVMLATSYMVAAGLLAVVVQHTIDLRFEILIQYAVVPFLQTAVVAWLAGAVPLRPALGEVGNAVRNPLVAGLWCITAVFLVCYWLPLVTTDLTRPLLQLAGIETLAAAILFVSGSRAGGGSAIPKMALFALLLTLLASNAAVPWLGDLPRSLPSTWPLLARQALVLWVLLLVSLALTAAAGSVVAKTNRSSAFFLSAVHPLAIAAALAVSLNWAFYSYPVEPWIHVFVTCVHIGATATLTAALVLRLDIRSTSTDVPPAEGRHREVGFIGLWLILTLAAFAGMAGLNALVRGQWSWGATTWLSLALPPLVEAAWLRFSREIRALPAAIRELYVDHPRSVALVLAELIAMVWLWNSAGLDDADGGLARTALAVYAALKVAVIGAVGFVVFHRGFSGAAVLAALATITGLVGIGAGLSGASVWLPVVGLLFVRWALARTSRQPGVAAGDDRGPGVLSHHEVWSQRSAGCATDPGDKGGRPAETRETEDFDFHLSAVDALLAPALVLAVGGLVSPTTPMIVSAPLALSMVVLAASASAMALLVWTPAEESKIGQKSEPDSH